MFLLTGRPRGPLVWGIPRIIKHGSTRSVGTSSVLDPDILAAAQKMAAEAGMLEDSKKSQLPTPTAVKVQMPATFEHAKELLDLNRRSKGLWWTFPIAGRSAPFNRRIFLTYDSPESATEAMDALRTLNHAKNLQFLAQLWHLRKDVPPLRPPGPVIAIYLGFHGTLEDAHRLFQDWSPGTKPLGVRLGYDYFLQRPTAYATFKSVEAAGSAKLRLEKEQCSSNRDGPPIIFGYYDERVDARKITPAPEHNRIMVWGLGPRATEENVSAFFQEAQGLKDIRTSMDWQGHSHGKAFLQFDSASNAKRARAAFDGLVFPASGDVIQSVYTTGRVRGSLTSDLPKSTLKLTQRSSPSSDDLRALMKLTPQFPGLWYVWQLYRGVEGRTPNLFLNFSDEDAAEAARQLCVSRCGTTWSSRLVAEDLPGRLRHSRTTVFEGGKTLTLAIGYHDTLRDLMNAVLPLGAVEVRLLDRVDAARVTFSSEHAAQAAMEALQHRTLRDGGPPVTFMTTLENGYGNHPPQTPRTNALWVSGLGRRTSVGRMAAFLKNGEMHPEIKLLSHWSGLSLGYGYLFFDTAEQAEAAKALLDGKIYPDSGNPLVVSYMQRLPEENAYLEVFK